ncbi:hypothetical protein KIPB_007667, partial [Kipferlia bialata]
TVRLRDAHQALTRQMSTVASFVLMFSNLAASTVNIYPRQLDRSFDWVCGAALALDRLARVSTVSVPPNTSGLTCQERIRYPVALRYNEAVCEFYSSVGHVIDSHYDMSGTGVERHLRKAQAHQNWSLLQKVSIGKTIDLLGESLLGLGELEREIVARPRVGPPGDTSKKYTQEDNVLFALLSLVFPEWSRVVLHPEIRKRIPSLPPKEAFKRIKKSRHPAAVRAMTPL